MVAAMAPAIRYNPPATSRVTADPPGPLPVVKWMVIPARPPRNDTMVPTVGATELAITSVSSLTTCGRAADSEDRKNRLTPSTASTPTYSGTPSLPEATREAVRATNEARSTADQTRICRRDQRSMNTPANGPISEYGR